MNILMVTPVHPSTPHISAVRAWRFAQELAFRGHHVMLLTAVDGDLQSETPRVPECHDWSQPAITAVPCMGPATRQPRPGNLFGKALTVLQMLRHGGRSGEWVNRAVHFAKHSTGRFRPDVVWCTFGLLEAVVAARRIAAAAHCPWVLDVKDNWELYVPRGMRRVMAWRIAGFSEVVANAQLTAHMTLKWLRRRAQIVYSGVDPAFFPAQAELSPQSTFAINLVGSTYFPEQLAQFMAGVNAWLEGLNDSDRCKVVLRYLGGDVDAVATTAAHLAVSVNLELAGYRPIAELAQHCRHAAVNAYIAHPFTFHHKLLELLACRRPILAFPSERPEAIDLACRMGGDLVVADSQASVVDALNRIHGKWKASTLCIPHTHGFRRYSWPDQTAELEQVLARAANRSSKNT